MFFSWSIGLTYTHPWKTQINISFCNTKISTEKLHDLLESNSEKVKNLKSSSSIDTSFVTSLH